MFACICYEKGHASVCIQVVSDIYLLCERAWVKYWIASYVYAL